MTLSRMVTTWLVHGASSWERDASMISCAVPVNSQRLQLQAMWKVPMSLVSGQP